MSTSLRQKSALLPIIMSVTALGIVLGHFAAYGIVHEADEGTPDRRLGRVGGALGFESEFQPGLPVN